MQKLIEFHDDNGHKVLTHDDKLTLTLKADELIVENSSGKWVVVTTPQTTYVDIRKQIWGVTG